MGFVMKNKLLTYAIGISVVVHLVGVCVVARTSASKLKAAPDRPQQQRMVNVDIVQTPDEATRPKPVAPRYTHAPRPEPRTNEPRQEPLHTPSFVPEPERMVSHSASRPTPQAHSNIRPHGTSSRPAGNPGGKLNIGSTSSHGDLGGGWSGGRTPVGWVPGSDRGRGQGSGSGVGIGTPDPPRHADDGPGERPAPRQDPPPPRMVSVRVCNESGLLPGRYCDRTHSEEFIEGREPSRTCEQCRAPEPPKRDPEPVHISRLADRSDPELIKEVEVDVPRSLPEGELMTVRVEYTVTSDGDVADVKVIKSSGYKALDNAVVKAVSRYKYKPAVQNGVPRSVPRARTFKVPT